MQEILSPRLRAVCGIGYITWTVLWSTYALTLFTPYMENCLFWPNFVSLDILTFVSTALNYKLNLIPRHTSESFNLLALNASIFKLSGVSNVNPAYPRSLMYEELNTVSNAIHGMRVLDTGLVNYMITPYCWVDFNQKWAIAHTVNRLKRCLAKDADNGAVYLEAILRNIDIASWLEENHDNFYQHIGNAIIASGPLGVQYISGIINHHILPIDEEISLWYFHKLTRFQLQFGNRVQIGLQDNILIENALGVQYQFSIKSIPAENRGASWTSATMSDGLGDDFNAIAFNQSLVINSSQWFGLFDTSQIEDYAVGLPLSQVNQIIHDQIGPLGDIDLRWIAPPPELIETVELFNSLVIELLVKNDEFYSIFTALPTLGITIVPLRWLDPNLRFVSGNPMCGHVAPMSFVQRAFGFDDACGTEAPFSISSNAFNGLFSMLMLQGDTTNICKQIPNQEGLCETLLFDLEQARHLFIIASNNITIPIPDLVNLKLSKMEFVLNNSVLSIQEVLVLEEYYNFFGWIHIYDWAMNIREVVSFEGDYRSLNLMSYANTPVANPLLPSMQSSIGSYLWYDSLLVTFMLGIVGILTLIFYLLYRPPVTHWFLFNRITSAVWLNRSVLLMRSITAIICLSTAPVKPIAVRPDILHLVANRRNLIRTFALASEATWFTYVCHDILHPLTVECTRNYAIASSALSWLVISLLDAVYQVELAPATLQKQCEMINMDWQVYCTSAVLRIGEKNRVVLIFVLQLIVLFICFIAARLCLFYHSHSEGHGIQKEASQLLHSSAIVFLPKEQNPLDGLDRVTAVMAGLFPITFKKKVYIFQVNLWRLVPFSCSEDVPPCIQIDVSQNPQVDSFVKIVPVTQRSWILRKKFRLPVLALGFAYLTITLTSNILYYSVVAEDLSNDYGWAGFNSSGAQAFLANVYNRQLLVTQSKQSLELDSAVVGDLTQLYNGSKTMIIWAESSARRQVYSALPLSEVIMNLRQMNPCNLPWMFTQYCWLDFNQTWSMASKKIRQKRCKASMQNNGAVYLESALRNMKSWDMWNSCWGQSFEIGISSYLKTSAAGNAWLATTKSIAATIPQEVEYWNQNNITSFILQWQNYKTPGMTDSLTIQSALGMSYSLQLSQSLGNYHTKQQTSYKMYWTFASDLWAVSTNKTYIGGNSLIGNSPQFAFSNHSPYSLLVQNTTMLSPPTDGFSIFRSLIGPFGAIDIYFVPCPQSLLELYSNMYSTTAHLNIENLAAQEIYRKINCPLQMAQVPTALITPSEIRLLGGNIFCGGDGSPWVATNGLPIGFSVTNMCHVSFSDNLSPTTLSQLFALFSFNASFSPLSTSDYKSICSLDVFALSSCVDSHQEMLNYLTQFSTVYNSMLPKVRTAQNELQRINVSIAQYVLNTTINKTTLYIQPLLDHYDRPWNYYGWLYIYEWAIGQREVITINGDVGSLTTISSSTPVSAMVPDPNSIPLSFSYMSKYCVQYITLLLIGVGVMLAISAIFHKGNMESVNLMSVNRIVGMVWVGRPFVLVRSLSAIWLLNTSPLALVQVGIGTKFTSPPLAWYTSLLATSEMTWFVYVLNDIFSCVTQQYTSLYASKSSTLTWIVAFLWTLYAPQLYHAEISRTCTYQDMDFQLNCQSGIVAVGSISRFGVSMGIICVCVIASYTFYRIRYRHISPRNILCHVLNAKAYYLLNFSRWQLHDELYIDKTSAIMAGLLSFELRNRVFVLDIKTWRFYTLAATHLSPTIQSADVRFRHALPMQHWN
ncbi:hypothetical protein THRCLA_00115 [Thraustotheca clavata]|uniref:Uncharacterized protein n=1 Tax=Thraustotheca clavata TaxID=74557 RepID=A0A1W0AC82_9STRA|nr:hypothetical protein THRCLA_00115 [Thraustotheca clavata]